MKLFKKILILITLAFITTGIKSEVTLNQKYARYYRATWQRSNLFKYTRVPNDTRQLTALHEAAHAVVALSLGLKISFASIVRNSKMNGFVIFASKTKRERMLVALGGPVIENICSCVSPGAFDDLDIATEMAAYYIPQYKEINRTTIAEILAKAKETVKKILLNNLDFLFLLKDTLLNRQYLYSYEIKRLFRNYKKNHYWYEHDLNKHYSNYYHGYFTAYPY